MLGAKNPIAPFDEEPSMEFLANKNDASLFAFANHNKKRPDNMILGRLYDGHILDMIEVGVTHFRGVDEFEGIAKRVGSKPGMVFLGSEWEQLTQFQNLRNMLLDFFRGDVVDKVCLKGLDHVMVCSVCEEKVYIRHYQVNYMRSGTKVPNVQLKPMGPHMDLTLRRTKFASPDLRKLACKQPKQAMPKKVKNRSSNGLRDVVGRIHLGRQDLSSMQVRRVKALRGTGKRRRDEDDEEDDSQEGGGA
ncbi:unnamed protein product [Chrysoparadoxa australica]